MIMPYPRFFLAQSFLAVSIFVPSYWPYFAFHAPLWAPRSFWVLVGIGTLFLIVSLRLLSTSRMYSGDPNDGPLVSLLQNTRPIGREQFYLRTALFIYFSSFMIFFLITNGLRLVFGSSSGLLHFFVVSLVSAVPFSLMALLRAGRVWKKYETTLAHSQETP